MYFEKKQLEERLKIVEKEIRHIPLINLPAMVVIGLSLYAKLGHNPELLHPLFTNSNVVNGALAIAIPWAVFCAYKSRKLSSEASELKKKLNC
ncbi:MAG: hypothetical protein ACJAZP_002734 [Psychromonas sp.]|jgi:hypothetical protein|uniref:hypothetical protein n=1 Tax=Psychromonas sp. TaxID=1884585 RepID=UPI0039E5BC47